MSYYSFRNVGFFLLLQNCLPLIQTLRAVCILPKEAASAWVSRGGRPDLADKDILKKVMHLHCFLSEEMIRVF